MKPGLVLDAGLALILHFLELLLMLREPSALIVKSQRLVPEP